MTKHFSIKHYHALVAVLLVITMAAVTVAGCFPVSLSVHADAVPVSDAARKAVQEETGLDRVTVTEPSDRDYFVYDIAKNGEERLACKVRCRTAVGSYDVVLDAGDGTVLDLCPATFTEAAICYDANGKQLTGSYNEKLKKYILGNESQNLYIFSMDGKNYYAGANGTYLDSDDNIFGNAPSEKEREYDKGTQLYRTMETIRRYYKNAYGVTADKYLIAMYNDAYDNGNNSFATDDILWTGELLPVGTVVGVISIGFRQDPTSIDLLAHEYMHRVEQNMVGLLYRGESGSIMEAYSDVFGELAEAGISGKAPDWVHNGVRDLVNPTVHGYPATYKGQYYVTGQGDDNGAVHKNSTVLSHAAYLMWYGIDGTASRRIDSATLARLWLNALKRFSPNETFEQCAKTIYDTALSMDLSANQRACVAEAFKRAGLPVRDKDKANTAKETVPMFGVG